MLAYIIRRILATIPILLIVITVIFLLLSILPGNVAILTSNPRSMTDPQAIHRLEEKWGLNKPVYIRYFKYLKQLVTGDLGFSYRMNRPVSALLGERLWPTIQLALLSLLIAVTGGVLLGSLAALHRGSSFDLALTVGAVGGVSMPEFWLGLLLIMAASVKLQLLPTSGYGGLRHIILPALTLGLIYMAFLARINRSSVLEEMYKEHVQTARAKGLPEILVGIKHILKNAFIPTLTVIGLQLGSLISRVVVVEVVFGWPGLGRLMVQSIHTRDIPTVQGCALLFASFYVFINLFVDILYAFFDPRIKYG